MTVKLFRRGAIFSPEDEGRPLRGEAQGRIRALEEGALLVRDGLIDRVGPEAEVLEGLCPREVDQEYDLEGACVIPGLVDPHTHLCFAARREEEFRLRLEGTPYLEILRRGGGILSSVRATRSASEEALFAATLDNATAALRWGTTTVEIKSGYGLETETELRMLEVIDRIRRTTPLDVVATFMGAHAVPEEDRGNPEAYVERIVREMIPAVAEQGIASFCDVFCEEGVFSVDQSRRILQAARGAGLGLKVHADEVHDLGGARLAGELGALSAEHLLAANDEGLAVMAAAGTVAVCLPATAYSLRKPFARARRMIELGVPLAVATDCNPGSCFCDSMPFVFGLSVMGMDLSVEEALVASTLNAAYAIDRAATTGSLDPGKNADFLVLDGESPAIFAYHAGGDSLLEVYKRGERVA
jgi:imidazolonepropionase